MKHYAVIGRGGGNKRVILASLSDLPQDSHFHVMWLGEDTSEGQEIVYDWLIDNEKTFTIYGKDVPKGLTRFAEDVSTAPMYKAVTDLGGTTALILWEEGMDDDIITASTMFPKMLELTNGLTPIEVDDDETPPPVVAAVEPEPVPSLEEMEFFSRAELEAMPAAAVKRQAKEKGLDITGKVKSQIIDMLLGAEGEEPAVVDATPAVVDPVVTFTEANDLSVIQAIISDIKAFDKEIAALVEQREYLVKVVSQALDYEELSF